MPINVTIVSSWKDAEHAYLAVSVNEGIVIGGNPANTEYIGVVPLAGLAGLSAAAQKALLIAAVKAQRDFATNISSTDLGLSGTVAVG